MECEMATSFRDGSLFSDFTEKGLKLIAKSASRTKMLFCLDDESRVTGNVNFGGVYYQHNLVHQACNC